MAIQMNISTKNSIDFIQLINKTQCVLIKFYYQFVNTSNYCQVL